MQRPFDIKTFLKAALAEDIGDGDITTDSVIPVAAKSRLLMRARQKMVLAGAVYLPDLFRLIDKNVKVTLNAEEGDDLEPGDVIALLEGPARALLTGERVALNLVQQLSGVATLTRKFVDKVGGDAKITDTRKTVPGMRHLQKYAVRCGGGVNHRMGLHDAVLIKDNHIAIAGSVTKAVKAAKKGTPKGTRIEVECDTLAQVEEAIKARADMVLLDNMDLTALKKSAILAKVGGLIVEVSGNVTLETVSGIAKCGVDLISIGRLTHSAPSVDIGLDDA